jgi:Na+-driven multidrug efflux pump
MFVIPLMLILPLFMGIDGIIFAEPISDLLACLIAVFFIRREFKKINRLSTQ